MAMYKPQRRHRAQHGNYFSRPPKRAIQNLMKLYAGVDYITRITPVKKEPGVQLKIEFNYE